MLFNDGPGLRVPHMLLEWGLRFGPHRLSMEDWEMDGTPKEKKAVSGRERN